MLLFILMVLVIPPARATPAPCDHLLDSQRVMRDLHAYFDRDLEADMRRAGEVPSDRAVLDYKNNVEPLPGRSIRAGRLLPAATDLKARRSGETVTRWGKEVDLTWEIPDGQRDLVTSLRQGDIVVTADEQRHKLGAFVGSGGTTHVFELKGQKRMLRVPRAALVKYTNRGYANREEKTAYFYDAFRATVERHPDLPLIDAEVRDGLVVVEDLRPYYTAAHLANDFERNPEDPRTALRRWALTRFLKNLRGRSGLHDVFLDAVAWHPTRHEWVIADFAALDPAPVARGHFHAAYATVLREAKERLGLTLADLDGVLDAAIGDSPDFHSTAALPLPLTGIVTPLVTPFTGPGGKVDVPGLARVIERVLSGGVRGVMVLGTNGEANDLDEPTKLTMIRETCRLVGRAAPVLVNVSSRDRAQTVRLARAARVFGAGAVVLSPPPEDFLTQDQLLERVVGVAGATNLPVFLYNIPQNTRVRFEPATVLAAARVPGVVGLKDSSGDLEYFRELKTLFADRPNFSLMIGSESILAQALAEGAHGGISGSSNVWPEMFAGLFAAVRSGDPREVARFTGAVAEWKTRLKLAAGPHSSVATFKALLARGHVIASPAPATTGAPWTPEETARLDQILEHPPR